MTKRVTVYTKHRLSIYTGSFSFYTHLHRKRDREKGKGEKQGGGKRERQERTEGREGNLKQERESW